jgi:hypothetical protein
MSDERNSENVHDSVGVDTVHADTSDGNTADTTTETTDDTNDTSTVAKRKRNIQLAAARESAKAKKRKREEDLDSMQHKLDALTELIKTKEEETEKPTKKKKVTTADETYEEKTQESSYTGYIRTAALISLAGASYYFQNLYGKSKKKIPEKKTNDPLCMPAQFDTPRTHVGKSGFVM